MDALPGRSWPYLSSCWVSFGRPFYLRTVLSGVPRHRRFPPASEGHPLRVLPHSGGECRFVAWLQRRPLIRGMLTEPKVFLALPDTFVNLTINCHFCYICYLAFVSFIVFSCQLLTRIKLKSFAGSTCLSAPQHLQWEHAISDVHVWTRHQAGSHKVNKVTATKYGRVTQPWSWLDHSTSDLSLVGDKISAELVVCSRWEF